MGIEVGPSGPVPERVEEILRGLPEWFGIEEALLEYVEQARTLPTYTAVVDGRVEGVCLLQRHFPHTAEIQLLAVRRDRHRRGIGRALLDSAERDAAGDGVEVMQVKTLGVSHPSPEYAETRRFYEALGYRALEEFAADVVWPGNPCLLMVKPLAPGR